TRASSSRSRRRTGRRPSTPAATPSRPSRRWPRSGRKSSTTPARRGSADSTAGGPVKSLTEHLWFDTKERVEFVNITPKVEELVKQSGVKEGMVLVNAMHITASVFINDDERGLHNDFKR